MLTEQTPGAFMVFDDVLVDPVAYRARALAQPYASIIAGPDTFHGIAPSFDASLSARITALVGDVAVPLLTFFRRSPRGQVEPNYVHSDVDMGEWTGICYLTEDPPAGDGTSFWQRRDDGARAGAQDGLSRDVSAFDRWHHVEARFNRLLIFRSDMFHSRGLPDNYGIGQDARLIRVVFGRGRLFAAPQEVQ